MNVRFLFHHGVLCSVLTTQLLAQNIDSSAYPRRLTRAESFLGVHFDFHAGPDCTEIGRNTTPEMIEKIIDTVRPDYLQTDSKGHRGLTSYPTKVGNQAPGFVGDPLRIWREVTARRGVALYVHHSGVWDSEAIRLHPDWGAVNADGSVNGNATSFFGPYADQLLIPQLREMASAYQIDGAWVDGECWASVPDYSEAAVRAFRERTGFQEIPHKPGDPHWREFLDFHRELFRKYLRHYVAEVKKTNPGFQLCSNWAFTDHMAEPVSVPLDFLSGDFSPEDSVNSARLSGRFLVRQGKPWDLMAWSFTPAHPADGRTQKTAIQLEQEAAVVLALGGGFQAYFQQGRDASVDLDRMPVMGEVAKFCRARQAFCHRSAPVPQIAVLLSTAGHYHSINGLFPRELGRVSGTLQALLENQETVDIVNEAQISGHLSQFPLIVIPEWEYLAPAFREELVSYVRGGGNLLLVGRSIPLFATELDIKLTGDGRSASSAALKYQQQTVKLRGSWLPAIPGLKAKAWGEIQTAGETPVRFPAGSVTPLGRGKIAALFFSVGETYPDGRSPELRSFLADLTRELFANPLVRVTGSPEVDVVVNRLGGKLHVHLVNTSGPHRDHSKPVFDEIPAIGPLTVTITSAELPQRITMEPGHESLPVRFAEGRAIVTVPKVDIYRILRLE